MSEKKTHLPVVALRGMTVLPYMIRSVEVRRPKSLKALEKAMSGSQQVLLLTQLDDQVQDPTAADLHVTGTVASIRNISRFEDGHAVVLFNGICRAVLLSLTEQDGSLEADMNVLLPEQQPETDPMRIAMVRNLQTMFRRYARLRKALTAEVRAKIAAIENADKLMDQIAMNLPISEADKQKVLDAVDPELRYETLAALLMRETEVAAIGAQLQEKVKARIDKNQKEYYLREQLKVIQEELGEDIPLNEADQYRQKLAALDAPEEVKEKLSKEISRFKSLGGSTAEASVSRTYIETLLDMPWNKHSEDNTDLKHAAAVLDEDHYGLEKVKERVLEFLAVRSLTKKGDSPILCLAGPPGTGKTSVARSVARALGKKYVRISLGGVRDEAEIRGHRRTYIGAMPGRIAAGLRSAGVNNPLMLFDEIDKLSSSYNGDPASAMLEVLDSEQNCRFSDHYIDVPIDLSNVLFIATANDLHTVPRPLLDRMEIIEVSSYTENEKLHIAKEHLIEKQKEHHGLEKKQLTISNKALQEIISGYTKEAGVRQLERRIGEICRKAARQILEDGEKTVRIKAGNLEEYLGKREYHIQKRNEENQVGIVRGLAWTAVGGVTLQIEVNVMPGKGSFLLTGQLGDVMKESAQTAISYVRSIASAYQVEDAYFAEHDIHIHIPEGAVPKDGPSAGITMATAILSAVTGIPVRADVAMTGEITLRGRVLAIGGLKEKLLAARNAQMTTVIVPDQNRADVAEVSGEITDPLTILYVKDMKEVLEAALEQNDDAHDSRKR